MARTGVGRITDLSASSDRRKKAILRALRQFAPMSRVELADLTGISKPTVTRLTLALLEEGLVREIGFGASSKNGGKPRAMLGLDPTAAGAVGCVVQPGLVSAALCSFDGTVESRSAIHFDPDEGPKATLQHMVRAIREVMGSRDSSPRPVAGVGVGLPGMVNDDGTVFMARMPGWGGIPVKAILSAELSLPVRVDNAARLNTLAEMWFGSAKVADSAVVLDMSDGIAAGVIIRGALWRGAHSLAGEVGHTHWGTSGRDCRCGGSSCWEHTASTTQLLADIEASGALTPQRAAVQIADVAAHLAEPTVWRVVEDHARALADGIGDIILTYDPELIVVRGGSEALGPVFMDEIRRLVAQRFVNFEDVEPAIVASDLGANADVLGAVSLVLRDAWGFDLTD